MQSNEAVLGPIQQVGSPADMVTVADPVDQQQQEQQQEKSADKQKSGDDSDDTADTNLALINTGPVQTKSDLEQPVTSGGMDTMIENPGNRN